VSTHEYFIDTVTRSTTSESWTVTSDRALTLEELTDAINERLVEGVAVAMETSETSDEDEREIVDVYVEQGTLATDDGGSPA
jgi:hypothetical protein